ncbi:MAG TPA: hypothetical protein VFT22_04340 [Kofleriaceae bacterium]|nr:hypothetical protein [Kofleriaceae bacterium]
MQGRIIIVIAIAQLATACTKEKAHATVNCEVVAGPAVVCRVEETRGTIDVRVCWDFKLTCDNGATLTADRACAHVADGKTTTVTLGTDKLKLTGTCEGEKHGSLEPITIEEAPAQR